MSENFSYIGANGSPADCTVLPSPTSKLPLPQFTFHAQEALLQGTLGGNRPRSGRRTKQNQEHRGGGEQVEGRPTPLGQTYWELPGNSHGNLHLPWVGHRASCTAHMVCGVGPGCRPGGLEANSWANGGVIDTTNERTGCYTNLLAGGEGLAQVWGREWLRVAAEG